MRYVLMLLTGAACTGAVPLQTADEACLHGWWHGLATKCSLECPGQPECGESDCQSFDYLGFNPDHTVWTGYITVSASMKRVSSFGPRASSTWSLNSEGLTLRSGGTPVEARCGGNRLDLGLASNQRFDAQLGVALERLKGLEAFASESF